MDDYTFILTPASGERLSRIDEWAQQANITSAVVGHGVMETSFGRNAALKIAASNFKRFIRQEFGEVSVSDTPIINGLQMTVPPMNLHLRGDTLTLDTQNFDLARLGAGNYALVLETWVALVGATTWGQATQPGIEAGVVDSANKPNNTQVYLAGNITGVGLDDAVLADTSIQTMKVFQRQYRLRLIPDADLTSYDSDLLAPGSRYAATSSPALVEAVIPENLGAWAQSVDRRYQACKLAVVTVAATGLSLHTADFRRVDTYVPATQPCAPLRLTREQLEDWLESVVHALSVRVATTETRLAVVEAARQAAQTTSDQDQTVMPVAADGSVIPQRLRFTREGWDTEGWHDPTGYPTRITLPFNGVVQVNATAAFAANAATGLRALRLLQNGIPTAFAHVAPGDANFDTAITLSAEIVVTAGDYLEIEPWQASGATLTVRQGAVFNVRRVL